ncbi:MAG: hypothetical protein RR327_05975 [Clostridia bacterium]
MFRIAVVGIDNPTYYARELKVFEKSVTTLKEYSKKFDVSVEYERFISSKEEAQNAVEQINLLNFDMVLLQNSGFSTGDIALAFENVNCPLVFWAVEEPQNNGDIKLHSLVSLNLFGSIAKRVYNRKAYVSWVYGNAETALFQERILKIIDELKSKNKNAMVIGYIGDVAPTFFNLSVDDNVIFCNLNMTVLHLSENTVIEESKRVSAEEIEKGKEILRNYASKFEVNNKSLEDSIIVAYALKRIIEKYNLNSLAISCWPFFQDAFSIVPCVAFMLASTLTNIPIACEGDIGGAVSMAIIKQLSQTTSTIMDFTQISEDNSSILMWHCGIACKEVLPKRMSVKIINHPMMNRKLSEKERFGCSFDAKLLEGEYTVSRFTNDFRKLFYIVGKSNQQLAEGFDGTRVYLGSLNNNENQYNALDVLNTIMKEGVEHHLVLTPKNIENELKNYCKAMGIEIIPIEKY